MEKIEKLTHAVVGPHSLERYGPLLGLIQGCLLIIGVIFWWDAASGSQNFTHETWGRMAYSFQAEFWAFINMTASTISLIGLLHPVHRRMVLVGGTIHMSQFTAISYSAAFTGGDIAVALYASVLLLTINIFMTAGALAGWRR